MLPLNLSDTAATSQDGSSLEFIAAFAGRQCYIQDARSRGLCSLFTKFHTFFAPISAWQCFGGIHSESRRAGMKN